MSDDHSCDYCKGGMSPCAADPDLWDYESDEDRDTDTAMDKAAQRERAAIVAWLEDAKRGDLSGLYLASCIERGDHVGGDND